MDRALLRRAIAFFIPAALVLTVGTGLAYVSVQQVLRSGANDPQVQLAEDAAAALDSGSDPGSVTGPGSAVVGMAGPAVVDPAVSLAPFVVVFDVSGAPLASNARLDGAIPAPPAGVLEAAKASGRNAVTWQPRPGVRIATVTVPWSGGTALAGRSLRVVEEREDQALFLAGAAWAAGLVSLALAALLAGWIWPRGPREPGGAGDPGA
jgi:hypothetical protein